MRPWFCFLHTAYYVVVFVLGVCIWLDQSAEWTKSALICIPSDAYANFTQTFYYGIQVLFYLASIAYLFWPENEAEKQFGLMLVHHIITLTLIGFSYATQNHRVGIYIMMLHDAGDIFLYLAEGCKDYVKFKRVELEPSTGFGRWSHLKLMEWTTSVSFVLFTLTFMYTRLWLFCAQLIPSCFRYLDASDLGRITMWSGLVMLGLMHCFWFTQIVAMWIRLYQNGLDAEDVREKEI